VPSQPDANSPADFTAPFDTLVGLRYTEIGPDGVRASSR